jgi:hypothetical protein
MYYRIHRSGPSVPFADHPAHLGRHVVRYLFRWAWSLRSFAMYQAVPGSDYYDRSASDTAYRRPIRRSPEGFHIAFSCSQGSP